MTSQGYYGSSYDRYLAHNEHSTVHKLKETYWTTKQAVIKKLGKKEDEHVVASDAELDSKLEVFKAIQYSCMDLLRVIEKYQDRLCALSQEENCMGRFLKSGSQRDKTRAGKMMAAVGKAQSFSSQQRLALRVPLVRLYQEVETFRYRAISDTLMTINRMETTRTEYRGALLWMKDVSEELDPDTYKQLEKFRKVQAQVKKTKAKFDKLKLDTMQKIDLLAASRCNMFSHVLANYQSTLLHFWSKTSRNMSAVAESFKGYQFYEFNMLKELSEPSKKLAEETGTGEASDNEPRDGSSAESGSESPPASRCSKPKNEKLHRNKTNDLSNPQSSSKATNGTEPACPACLDHVPSSDNTVESFWSEPDNEHESSVTDNNTSLISFDEQKRTEREAGLSGTANLLDSSNGTDMPSGHKGEDTEKESGLFMDFEDEEEQDIEEIKRKQEEEFDFSGRFVSSSSTDGKKQEKMEVPKDLLSEEYEPDEADKDEITLLNEILNAPSTGGDDFSREWQAVFGTTPLSTSTNLTPVEMDKPVAGADFMPSSLLDMDMARQVEDMNIAAGLPGQMMGETAATGALKSPATSQTASQAATQKQPGKQVPKPKSKKDQKKDMSAWFNLFADLDPLSNPDAIGRNKEDFTDA